MYLFEIVKYSTGKLVKTQPTTFFQFKIAIVFIVWITNVSTRKLPSTTSICGCRVFHGINSVNIAHHFESFVRKFSYKKNNFCFILHALPLAYLKRFVRSTNTTRYYQKTNVRLWYAQRRN